ncbi:MULTISPECIES: type IVB secretion system protein IcmM/DotJ [Legionella]|uniref:Component of the Dot/Icm secretion system, predicted inner membrane protein n=1 Tax=Legionella drozanskii LLAP-1 TaxID=1212489 RepID=A0A0W0SRS0_9GAMM|nr:MULTISPECIES: type IVB secretion system protein IcmM/DotJ [Legionella]KTC85953.1 Component of the Dot/Icm secretion system, predicted inner membrane protein [Legionella drozanskii LLAP-1]PJE17811.1 MAG: phosphoesterase [Legionella sp.]
MSRETWNTIINSKSFYVRTYRMGGRTLIISLIINILLGLAIYYLYFHQPERDFYATSGITPPIQLKPMDEPNYSATPLLAPDPIENNTVKVIPQ